MKLRTPRAFHGFDEKHDHQAVNARTSVGLARAREHAGVTILDTKRSRRLSNLLPSSIAEST